MAWTQALSPWGTLDAGQRELPVSHSWGGTLLPGLQTDEWRLLFHKLLTLRLTEFLKPFRNYRRFSRLHDVSIFGCSKVIGQTKKNWSVLLDSEKQEAPAVPRYSQWQYKCPNHYGKRSSSQESRQEYDTIGTSVYMEIGWNNDRHKPPLLFGLKILSEWAVSDQNLSIDMFTWRIFVLISLLFRLGPCKHSYWPSVTTALQVSFCSLWDVYS